MQRLILHILVCVSSLIGLWGEAQAKLNSKSIVDLQAYKRRHEVTVGGVRTPGLKVSWTELNRYVADWYLLGVRWPGQKAETFFHLENADPRGQVIALATDGLALTLTRDGQSERCDLSWHLGRKAPLWRARDTQRPFAAMCQGRLFLRNQVQGAKTNMEWATDFVRRRMFGGERLINFVKDHVFKDHHLIRSRLLKQAAHTTSRLDDGPSPARVHAGLLDRSVAGKELAIALAGADPHHLRIGQWYPTRAHPNIYFSAYLPRAVPMSLRQSFQDRVAPLDAVENEAMVYLVAYDLRHFELGYALGTENPELGWSERTPRTLRPKGALGPDGINDALPLVPTGVLNPRQAEKIAAVFTGGFKRKHSVFRAGRMATENAGTHYGFLANGTLFSSLWPGLATVIVDEAGKVELKTWGQGDQGRLAKLRFVRQNGLPLVQTSPKTGLIEPGLKVRHNFAGNWSGDKDNFVRTLRSGLCLMPGKMDGQERKYLVYAYFSAHTPSAMARVFQAYGCQYAMHLDMNLPRHVYMALHRFEPKINDWRIDYLTDAMRHSEVKHKQRTLPRFVGAPDNRDFFYLLHK